VDYGHVSRDYTDEWQVLSVAVVRLDGKPTKDNGFGKKVESAIQLVSPRQISERKDFSLVTSNAMQGPTIFPIMFAAISGRSLKMIARYLAERGAKLGVSSSVPARVLLECMLTVQTLELLMVSQSVWGAVESQILMRRLTLVGANLLFLWTLSPLGGQASLRLLDKASSSNQTWTPLRYMSTGPGTTARISVQRSILLSISFSDTRQPIVSMHADCALM
jgi:hypothetical protein